MKRFTTLLIALTLAGAACAQRSEILFDRLRTLQVVVADDPNRQPVIALDSDEQLEISFDDLTHEYCRYTYTVQHCGFDWQPSDELFESDFLTSPGNEGVIDDYQQSMTTSTLYTHYAFRFPNSETRPLISGNYRISIMREDENGDLQPAATVCCAVVEPCVAVRAEATTNTDTDWNGAHQQLSMRVDLKGLNVRDARREVKTLVMQNRRYDNARLNPAPTSTTGTALVWDHCRDLIFEAGNEYRKFEMLNMRAPGMGVESVRWYDPLYHVALFPGERRRNYLYDEDRNGQAVIRTDEATDETTDCEYFMAHFTLAMPELDGQDVYVNGRWTHDLFTPTYRMTYNAAAGAYEAAVLLKQGYYSYQYVAVPHGSDGPGTTAPTEGNFYQTENEYTIMVYYHPAGARYDRLIGHTTFNFRPQ